MDKEIQDQSTGVATGSTPCEKHTRDNRSGPVTATELPKSIVDKVRSDKGQSHFSRHGLLSRDVERALVRLGEPVKNIRRWQRKFRMVLKPHGDVAELLFDKWWSCYLRQLLIAKLESGIFTGADAGPVSPQLPVLEERTQPTLVCSPQDEIDENFRRHLPDNVFQRLALIQRYDSHYSREGNRMFALLLLMREGGEDMLVKIFGATLGVFK